jgi:hypothetical protein
MAASNRPKRAGEPGRDDPGAHAAASADEMPTLSISREKVCHIVFKARAFDVKDVPTVPDDGSNPADEQERSVLEDRRDDPVVRELAAFMGALNSDEQADLVTLAWIGRGDGDIADWDRLRDLACNEHARGATRYLLGLPLLGDYLSEGLAQLGYSCQEFADEHLST